MRSIANISPSYRLRIVGFLLASLLLLVVAFSLTLHFIQQKQTIRPAAVNTGPLFGSFASFNGSIPQCITPDGTRIWTGTWTTFGSDYAQCRRQLLSDYDFLGQNNVKMLRIWPLLSTFTYNKSTNSWGHLNSYITNLDEALAEFRKNHMKAYVTLLSSPSCSTPSEYTSERGYLFNPDLVQNQTIQDEFISSFTEFITRYKDNPTIGAYDFLNEVDKEITAEPPTGVNDGLCGLYYDDNRSLKIKAFLTRIYKVAKSIDKMHPMTFSSGGDYPLHSQTMDVLHNIVDFYDVHLYSIDPASSYRSFPTYDKPVIQGEVGISSFDKCEPDNWDLAPEMSAQCQQIWLANAKAFVQQARIHHVLYIFFHFWPSSKRYGIRIDDGSHTFTEHKMTLAGQYIINLDSTNIAFDPPTVLYNRLAALWKQWYRPRQNWLVSSRT